MGTGKTLIPSGSVNDGNGGANYSVTFVSSTAGAITQTVDHFVVTASPTSVTAGNNFFLVVTAEDAGGNVVTNYGGTVSFTSSDPLEPHPAANVTFTPGSGVAYVLATLETAGSWSRHRHRHDELVDRRAPVPRSRSRRRRPRRWSSASSRPARPRRNDPPRR